MKRGTVHPNDTHQEMYSQLARGTAQQVGRSRAFLVALAVVLIWACSGPYFHFSDTWQLVINTGTTIVTFLMVFLIQYAQNRDNKTIQLKLDELIKAAHEAGNEMLDLERLSDADLDRLEQRYRRFADQTAHHRSQRRHHGRSERPSGASRHLV
jgi:low affinity Fe/Cu permease